MIKKSIPHVGFDVSPAWEQVLLFHRDFGLPVGQTASQLGGERVAERSDWMKEEIKEFVDASTHADQTDALLDLIYLALGTLVEMGTPPKQAFDLVHAANMAKKWPDGTVRMDPKGKLLKPPGWLSPEASIAALFR